MAATWLARCAATKRTASLPLATGRIWRSEEVVVRNEDPVFAIAGERLPVAQRVAEGQTQRALRQQAPVVRFVFQPRLDLVELAEARLLRAGYGKVTAPELEGSGSFEGGRPHSGARSTSRRSRRPLSR